MQLQLLRFLKNSEESGIGAGYLHYVLQVSALGPYFHYTVVNINLYI